MTAAARNSRTSRMLQGLCRCPRHDAPMIASRSVEAISRSRLASACFAAQKLGVAAQGASSAAGGHIGEICTRLRAPLMSPQELLARLGDYCKMAAARWRCLR